MTYQKESFDALVERMSEYLTQKKYVQARETLVDLEPVDIAFIMESLPEDTIPVVFRLLPKELAAEVFVELDTDSQEKLIKGFSKSELKEVVDELYLDDVVDIIEEMPANVVKRIIASADADTRRGGGLPGPRRRRAVRAARGGDGDRRRGLPRQRRSLGSAQVLFRSGRDQRGRGRL